jgi:hypothetical protein
VKILVSRRVLYAFAQEEYPEVCVYPNLSKWEK